MITEALAATPGDMAWSVAGREPHACAVQKTTALFDPHNSTLALSMPVAANALNRAIVVIDAGFDAHWGLDVRWYFEKWSIRAEFVVLDVGHDRTTAQTALRLAVRLGELRVDRVREPLIAIGGGLLLDAADLAATIFGPGAPYVRVPTTLLAQVDVGNDTRTGVDRDRDDTRRAPCRAPTHVLVDTAFLETLPASCLANGLAEILNVATLLDAHLFETLEANGRTLLDHKLHPDPGDDLVGRAIGVILAQQEPTPMNTRRERLADSRHRFGRAIEMAFQGDMGHGESVAIGLVVSGWIAHRRGLLAMSDLRRVIAATRGLQLATWDPHIDADLLVSALRHGVAPGACTPHLPLPVGVGKSAWVDDVTPAEVFAACVAAEAGLTWPPFPHRPSRSETA